MHRKYTHQSISNKPPTKNKSENPTIAKTIDIATLEIFLASQLLISESRKLAHPIGDVVHENNPTSLSGVG